MSSLRSVVDTALEATIVGSFSRIGSSVRQRLDDWNAIGDYDLSGRTVLVTGGNGGLGTAIATLLARTGATVRITVRSDEKGQRTLEEIRAASGNDKVSYDLLDLMQLDDVRAYGDRLVEELGTLDAVVHNAGAMFSERRETDGIENTVLLHVVAPMVLTHRLLPALRASEHPGRVVWLSSGGMYSEKLDVDRLQSPNDYAPAKAYARAKRAQVVLTDLLDRRLLGDVVVHAMHPGWAATPGVERSLPAFNTVMGPLLRSPEMGADTAAWLVAAPQGGVNGGRFWLDRRSRRTVYLPGTGHGVAEERRLWTEITDLADLPDDAFSPAASADA